MKAETNTANLEITSIDVFPVKNPEGRLRAFARVAINDQLQLTSLRIYEGTQGLFVSYPNDPSYGGEEYRQVFYPLTREFREKVETKVLAKYMDELGRIN